MNYLELLRRQRVINAPMFGLSDYPFRVLCREAGGELTFAEMVSAEGMIYGDRGRMGRPHLVPGESGVVMQLYGHDPAALAESARRLQDGGAVAIDLNMGCPMHRIVAGGSGAGLLCDLPRAARIFQAMRAAIQVPLTVKMRWDGAGGKTVPRGAALETARIAEAEGVDALCLHPRTRAQGYGGQACWDWIAMLKAEVSIPVIGNGDIREPADALAMASRTGCDAVMIGRALIGDPWLLGETIDAFRCGCAETNRLAPGWPERRRMIHRHAALMYECYGSLTFSLFRKHAAAYLRGLTGVRALRNRLMHVGSLEQLAEVLAGEPDPNDPTLITINTDEHEARLRRRPAEMRLS